MRRLDLVPDCGSCAALCCVATSFDASVDFAFAKAAGERCRYITSGDRCAIHAELIERGMLGCAVYDCHGAGPRVTRAEAASEDERHAAFLVLRVVHEVLWLLAEAAVLCPSLAPELERASEALDAIAGQPLAVVIAADLRPQHEAARAALRRVGEAMGGRRRSLPIVRR